MPRHLLADIPVDKIVTWLQSFHMAYPLVGILCLIMLLDVLIGLCAAFITQSVSSTISWSGMVRKVIMLLLVGLGSVLEPYAGELPLSKMIAMCFLVTECISIVENAARAGVPIPAPLADVLQKLKNNEKASVTNKNQPQSVVNIQRASNVDIKAGDQSSVHNEQTGTSPSDSKVTIHTTDPTKGNP